MFAYLTKELQDRLFRSLGMYIVTDVRTLFVVQVYLCAVLGARGGVVVKALRYKPAGRGFDSR